MTTTIKKGDKFTCSWGYDQTQVSVYSVVDIKGKFVKVEGVNSWSNFGESDLCAGSTVKIYKQHNWTDLTAAEQQDFASRGFNWDNYQYHYNKDAKEQAEVRTIEKVSRIDGQSWTYVWELDNGETIRSDENYEKRRGIEIVNGLKRCLVNNRWGYPSIKIDQVITASLDENYDNHADAIAAQNLYTSYNGR